MLPHSANPSPVSDAFKARITSLIQEQLKPIVSELAAQQQTLLNNLALLRHNHNVNDYQMTRLENIRDLEQSINFKVSGALGFDPWQHPTIGTNLREPVPADPDLIPQFMPISRATPAERAAQSAALIKEAGMSARQIGVPLTFQDFPDHPSMNSGAKKEDPMHASIPLFGLRAPRWRAKLGLDDDAVPGTAVYDGVVAPPTGGKGLRLYNKRAKDLMVPMWELIDSGIGSPRAADNASSSSSPGAGTSNSPGAQGVSAGAGLSKMPVEPRPTAASSSSPSTARSAHPKPKPLFRTYAIANMEDTITKTTPASNSIPKPSALRRTSTMATIASTTSETSAYSSSSRISTTATIGSEPPQPPPSSRTAAKAPTAKTKTKTKAAKAKQSTSKQRSTTTRKKTVAPTPTPILASPSPSLKRGRQTAESEDTTDDMTTDTDGSNQEDKEEAGPTSKRRKRSAASDTSLGSESTTTTTSRIGNEDENGQPARRSGRITRGSTAAPPPRPAPRGRATKGKKANERS